jgi:hypothetical protein
VKNDEMIVGAMTTKPYNIVSITTKICGLWERKIPHVGLKGY